MKAVGTLFIILNNERKCNVPKKFSQTMLALITFLLWISPGLGEDKPPDCSAQELAFCSSPCYYLKDKCNEDRECMMELCSHLFPQVPSQELQRCWNLPSDCDFRYASKRGILNRNVAYLLLKLHPFLNQTSQFGFLTSGRFRRITGNFGTEFLGKRSNNKATTGGRNRNPPKPSTTPPPKFYSLPLNNFAKSKILKRAKEFANDENGSPMNSRDKRLSIRGGNGRVILGSEFLGKRSERVRRLEGTEFLGKRDGDPFDGSEFLGKRQQDTLAGTELLGKKSNSGKRFGNELFGKRMELQEKTQNGFGKNYGFCLFPDYAPELVDEAFSSYDLLQNQRFPFGSRLCSENDSGICGKLKAK